MIGFGFVIVTDHYQGLGSSRFATMEQLVCGGDIIGHDQRQPCSINGGIVTGAPFTLIMIHSGVTN